MQLNTCLSLVLSATLLSLAAASPPHHPRLADAQAEPPAPPTPSHAPLTSQGTLLGSQEPEKGRKHDGGSGGVSAPLYIALERLSRLVDIAYCVGSTGLWHPFSCASRCNDFPSLDLVTTWNTGILMSDSCGYVAVDQGGGLLAGDPAGGGLGKGYGAGSAIIVAFRGTYSVTNTVVDLSTVPQKYVPYPSPPPDGDGDDDEDHGKGQHGKQPAHRCANCTVHMGFLASWRAARQTVLPTLRTLRAEHPDWPIHLVGHSLGGAVAALAALELRVSLEWDQVVATTFGEPRVGNEAFVKYLDAAFGLAGGQAEAGADKDPPGGTTAEDRRERRVFRRLTHADDPVPLLPLDEWGYRSHAGEIFIEKPGLAPEPADLRLCTRDYDPGCIAGSVGETALLARRPLDDHNKDGHRDRDGGGDGRGECSGDHSGPGPIASRWDGWGVPARFKLWQLFFAHRDYFWRLGLCVPGGDPIDWGRRGRDGAVAHGGVGGEDEL